MISAIGSVNTEEQQLRFASLQTGQVIVLATGLIVNWGVSYLYHRITSNSDHNSLTTLMAELLCKDGSGCLLSKDLYYFVFVSLKGCLIEEGLFPHWHCDLLVDCRLPRASAPKLPLFDRKRIPTSYSTYTDRSGRRLSSPL